MRLQSAQNGCGPATVANVMRAYGHEVTEEMVSRKASALAAINEENPALGTVESQIKRCLTALKVPNYEFTCHSPGVAVAALRGYLAAGSSALLAVDDDSHWLAVLATAGERFSVVDSADTELNVYYTGEALAERWGSNSDPPCFYGIVAKPRQKVVRK